ncbi:FtsX-like permease family protein [Microcella humidisoli]|uniref:FtsX-like permease family protein n=1 Tax=Microcella humidisoli TaxID=2963406 RepID=A0ABY5FUY7_9MICO|nr:FtsX-like permease family protein [Microcella humidisoli]UTT61596.1 FtsX-like permease family protein [Microcella humidisoli]
MMLVRRLRSRQSLLLATAGVVALSAGLGAGIGVLANATIIDGAGAVIGAAQDDDAVVRVAIRWAGQGGTSESAALRAAEEQDAAVRDALDTLMPTAVFAPQPSIRSEPLEVAPFTDTVVLLSDASLLDRVEVVEGTWPQTPREAALHRRAADALDVRIGDRITLPAAGDEPVEVTVAALWLPLDSSDPVWAGDPLVDSGRVGSAVGPLVVDEALWRGLSTRPIAQWVSALDPRRASPAALDQIAAGLPSLAQVIDDDPRSQGTGIVVDGGLGSTVTEVQRAAAGVGAVLPVAIALVGVAALTTLLELQRLLTTVRREEVTLLRSRGASPRRLASNAAVESLIIAVPGAVIGSVLGAAITLVTRPGTLERALADPAPLMVVTGASALAVAVVTVVLAVVITTRSARSALRRDTLLDSGRPSRAVSGAALVVSAIAAGVAVSQFVLYRGPIVPTAEGGIAVDPIAALTPVLVLVTGALLAVVLVEPLARLVSRATAGADRLIPVLISRSLARSTAIVTAPVLLIGFTVGGLVIAATVDATTRSSERAARELALGAELAISGGVLDLDARAVVGAAGEPVALAGTAWRGVPVSVAELTGDDGPGTLVAIDPTALTEVVAEAGGAVDRERIAAAIRVDSAPGIEIAATATSIRLGSTEAAAAFWVADAQGGVTRVAADESGEASLPGAGGPWRVLALDIEPVVSGDELEIARSGVIVTDAAGAETVIDVDEQWDARPGGSGTVRVMPQPAPVRLAVTPAAADRVGAQLGDSITVIVAGSGREIVGVVTDIVPAVPGAVTVVAVVADLVAVAQSQLAGSETPLPVTGVLLSPDDDAVIDARSARQAADELRMLVPSGSSVDAVADAPTGVLAEGARTALWVAALGALVLAIAAAAIVSRAIGGVRDVDVVVLRAIGVAARAQARARALEFGAVLTVATVGGIAVGTGAALLLVGDLARALIVDVPPALPVRATIEPVLAAVLGALLLGAIAALSLSAARQAARQARTLSAREVLR